MKKIHRFLVEQIPNEKQFSLFDKELIHQFKNVLKFSPSEEVVLFEAFGNDIKCKIVSLEKNAINFEANKVIEKTKIPKNVTACISITKKDTFEIIVQKLTELGITTLVPIISERTIKQKLNLDRLHKISIEALEQSGHSNKIKILEPKTLDQALKGNENKNSVFFDTKENESLNKKEIEVFYIGPEGGWSVQERALFEKYSINACSLGSTILRTETASIVASYKAIWG